MQPSSQPRRVRKTYVQTRAFLLFVDGLAILAALSMFLIVHPAPFDVLGQNLYTTPNAALEFQCSWGE